MRQHNLVEAAPDVVVIENLRVQARIGVHEYEYDTPQTVRFDIEMETVPGYLDSALQAGSYASYADAVDFIQTKAASGRHVRLVEEWAYSVADFILQNPLITKASVRVTKTDIIENAEGVGIRIVRRRP